MKRFFVPLLLALSHTALAECKLNADDLYLRRDILQSDSLTWDYLERRPGCVVTSMAVHRSRERSFPGRIAVLAFEYELDRGIPIGATSSHVGICIRNSDTGKTICQRQAIDPKIVY